MDAAQTIKEKYCYVALDYQKEQEAVQKQPKKFTLPDGKEITLGSCLVQCPESIFAPSTIGKACPGIQDLVRESIESTDASLHKQFWETIVLAGGSTMFQNLEKRLSKELLALLGQKKGQEQKVKIIAG